MAVIGFKNSQAGVEQVALRDDDDVEAGRDVVPTEDLSNQTFSTVSLDRATQLPGRRDTQSADIELVGQDEQRGKAAMDPGPVLVHLPEFGAAANPLGRTESHTESCYSLLTVSRLRPFARRRLRTSRPFLVLIRTRNPCVFLR